MRATGACVGLLAIFFLASLVAVCGLQQPPVLIPGARSLFGLSPAPQGAALIAYKVDDASDGELVTGKPILVQFGVLNQIHRLNVPANVDDSPLCVWTAKADTAYFLGGGGLYKLEMKTVSVQLVVGGVFAGLAMSPDGSKIAFWDYGKPTDVTNIRILRVFSVPSFKETNHWTVANLFDADTHGHEIAFSKEGESVQARTYDTRGVTPLREYSLKTGAIRTIWRDCWSATVTGTGTYFIGLDGGDDTRALFKLDSVLGPPRKLIPKFRYSELHPTAVSRWIVARDGATSDIALLDSQTNQIMVLKQSCSEATVLSDGRILCASGGTLTVIGKTDELAPQR